LKKSKGEDEPEESGGEEEGEERHRHTVRINRRILEEAKLAVRHASMADPSYTLERGFDDALRLLVRELERTLNGGKPFPRPKDPVRLKPGPRLSFEKE
jgi:hypothetical protein